MVFFWRSLSVAVATAFSLTCSTNLADCATLPPNDDGSSSLIDLGFSFRFFGSDYSKLYVNNNGNVTFEEPLSAYTPQAFPSIGPAMIAPFWADVDTRNIKGTVSYTSSSNEFRVDWTKVGYYDATLPSNKDLRNTFSLTLQKNNGIVFSYEKMAWTTGDASGGESGLGGQPASLGLNKGDGITSVVFRNYNSANVSNLNGNRFYFQTDRVFSEPPIFKQSTLPWGPQYVLNGLTTDNSGNRTDTFKNVGCVVTSVAIMLNSFGHNTDPEKLNVYLTPRATNKDGYFSNDMVGNSLAYGQTDGIPAAPVRLRDGMIKGNSEAEIVAELAQAIATYGPIMIRVPARYLGSEDYATDSHKIVAWKVEGNKVYIRDPGWSNSPATLGEYVDYVNNYVSTKGKPELMLKNSDGSFGGTDLSWLKTNSATAKYTYAEILTPLSPTIIMGSVHSPVEIVITDPLGRRVGFDPVLNEYYLEVPESTYGRDLRTVSLDEDAIIDKSLFAPVNFSIGRFLAGEYKVEVFGVGDGEWRVNFGVSDPLLDFDPNAYSMFGIAYKGFYDFRSFNVTGALPFPTVVSPVPIPSSLIIFLTAIGSLVFYVRLWSKRKSYF